MPAIDPIRGRLVAEERLRDLHRRFRAVSRRHERTTKALSRPAKAAICVAAALGVSADVDFDGLSPPKSAHTLLGRRLAERARAMRESLARAVRLNRRLIIGLVFSKLWRPAAGGMFFS